MSSKDKQRDKKDKSKKDDKHKKQPKACRLHEACVIGDLEAVEADIAKHKTWISLPNEEGRYPIHLACLNGHLPIVERLLKAGADVNLIEDRPGKWCVLHYAAHSKNKELFFFLTNLPEMKVVAHTNRDKNTPMHYFCRFFDDNYNNVLILLAKKGANVNAQNHNGETPLHNACWGGHLEIVHVLLDLGADPNLQNDHGETPLHWAARMGFDPIVEALLRANADPKIAGQNGTPLDVTRSNTIKKILDPLAGEEAKKQQKDIEERARRMIEQKRVTPFHWEIDFSEINLQGKIGAGGSGVVHKGTWRGIDVAVKLLRYEDIEEDGLDNLVHEISVISKLRHPNILLFLGASLQTPNICIVTELMPRGNLRDVMASEDLDWNRKLNIAIEITRGLQYLHSQTPPVLHRDLKTLNILVDDSYHIKVADFGATAAASAAAQRDPISSAACSGASSSAESSSNGTDVDQSYGATLYCLAPEVLDHKPYTAASDVYSLGLIFYEIASEEIPFEGLNNMQLLRAIDEGKLIPLQKRDRTCPADYAALVSKCLSKNADDRPSLDEIMNSLKAIKSKQNTQS